jgi:hypothetical protein
MTFLFYSVVWLTAALSMLDLYNTAKLVDTIGLDIEANPIAKWAWEKWGTKALVAFKVSLTALYVVAMGLIPITPIIYGAAIAVALVYAWVASRGQTIKAILTK